MCRMVIFSGLCVRCGAAYAVPELAQSISCLEAKNNGGFGNCHKGINYDQHDPAIECVPCGSAMGMGDGGGGNGDELVAASSSGSSRGSLSGAGGGGGSYDTSKRRRVR